MRTSRLLAVVIAATLAAFTTNAQADWVDDFTGEGQTWLLAGHNGNDGGAGSEALGGRGVGFGTGTVFFTGDKFSTINPAFPASLLGYVSQSFQNVTVSSVVSNIAIDVSSGLAVRMNPSLDNSDGLLGGYSFSVTQSADKIKFSLNSHEGTEDPLTSDIRSLASAEYDWYYDDGDGPLGNVTMSLTAVGNQLTGTFSFKDTDGIDWNSGVLTATDSTYDDGFSGIVSYAYTHTQQAESPNVIGAAAWGPVTSVTAVPEPGTMLALSLLGGGAVYKRYRSRRQPAAQPAA